MSEEYKGSEVFEAAQSLLGRGVFEAGYVNNDGRKSVKEFVPMYGYVLVDTETGENLEYVQAHVESSEYLDDDSVGSNGGTKGSAITVSLAVAKMTDVEDTGEDVELGGSKGEILLFPQKNNLAGKPVLLVGAKKAEQYMKDGNWGTDPRLLIRSIRPQLVVTRRVRQ